MKLFYKSNIGRDNFLNFLTLCTQPQFQRLFQQTAVHSIFKKFEEMKKKICHVGMQRNDVNVNGKAYTYATQSYESLHCPKFYSQLRLTNIARNLYSNPEVARRLQEHANSFREERHPTFVAEVSECSKFRQHPVMTTPTGLLKNKGRNLLAIVYEDEIECNMYVCSALKLYSFIGASTRESTRSSQSGE